MIKELTAVIRSRWPVLPARASLGTVLAGLIVRRVLFYVVRDWADRTGEPPAS